MVAGFLMRGLAIKEMVVLMFSNAVEREGEGNR